MAEETDIPPGIFQVVVSNDNDVASVLTSDPRVDMVTFTGSTAVGRKILAAAAPTVKKVVLELGGKSTHIVLDDADLMSVLPAAAGGVAASRWARRSQPKLASGSQFGSDHSPAGSLAVT